jgi:hypothetical protein
MGNIIESALPKPELAFESLQAIPYNTTMRKPSLLSPLGILFRLITVP